MSNEEKYFEVLSGAIAEINSDSFEARGVVYDQLWKIILERLQDESEASEEIIADERAAFLAAVKRIEFGERSPAASEQPPHPAIEPPLQAAGEGPLPAADKPQEPIKPRRPPKRASRGRIVLRMLSACALLVVVVLVYLFIRFDSTS